MPPRLLSTLLLRLPSSLPPRLSLRLPPSLPPSLSLRLRTPITPTSYAVGGSPIAPISNAVGGTPITPTSNAMGETPYRRTKHRYQFHFCEYTEQGIVAPQYTPTNEMLAVGFTKALDCLKFASFTASIGLYGFCALVFLDSQIGRFLG